MLLDSCVAKWKIGLRHIYLLLFTLPCFGQMWDEFDVLGWSYNVVDQFQGVNIPMIVLSSDIWIIFFPIILNWYQIIRNNLHLYSRCSGNHFEIFKHCMLYIVKILKNVRKSFKIIYYTLLLFYALWLVNCMQINATITQSADNSVIC